MTSTPKQPLVERVAVAIWNTWNRVMVDYGLHKQSNGDFYDPKPTDDAIKAEAHRLLRKAALDEAQAALDACHAEEMREALKTLMTELSWCARQLGCDWKDGGWRERSSVGRAYTQAEALLAKMDGKPSGGAV